MKKILMLGAGMVAKPMADYLLTQGFNLTIASRTVSKAKKLIGQHNNGSAIEWVTENTDKLEKLVESHDLTISLLPYTFHLLVAKLCIKHKKNMVTTSYSSADMNALDEEAKKAGVLILNEIGVDPGVDHMTAMQIIDKVHEDNGKIKKFYSLCGALPAPEEANNPFQFKFSWSPKGVLMASNNGAKYLHDKNTIEIPTKNLFKNPLQYEFEDLGSMEVYPNRDSLKYIDMYNIAETETMYRGTFRYPNWCESLDAIKALGMLDYKIQDFNDKSYKEIVAAQINVYPKNVKEKVAEKLNLELQSPAIRAMEWLGFFDKDTVQIKNGSTFELTSGLMQNKMMLPDGARDVVLMLHSFLVEKENGKKEVITARMVEYGDKDNTAISRTVALPAAIAAKLILAGKINETGVKIPATKSIYMPVLHELAQVGIEMKTEYGLPLTELPQLPPQEFTW